MDAFREGFYSVFYTGAGGSGVILLCLKSGKAVGIDPSGGEIKGTYVKSDEGISATLIFALQPGELATGQTLAKPVILPAELQLPNRFFAGDIIEVDIGTGPLNAKGVFVSDPL